MTPAELALLLRPLQFFNSHAAGTRDGLLELGNTSEPRVLVWNPEVIGGIWHADRTLAHPGSRTFRPVLGEHSLIWADGQRHRDYRAALSVPLVRQLHTYRGMIAGIVDSFIDDLTPGTKFSLADWTRALALRVMGAFVFGMDDTSFLRPFARWMTRAIGSRPRTLAYRHLRGGLPTAGPELDRLLVEQARAARRDPRTLSAHLLAHDSPVAGMDDDELRDQVVTLLFAGHETTASTAAWALYWLHRHPEIGDRVRAELDRTRADEPGHDGSPLLDAVVSETLRLTPPVPAAGTRKLATDCDLGDRRFRAGTVVMPQIYIAHRSPATFENPRRFNPDRFLDRDGTAYRRPITQFFPFGGGTRHCPGAQLGQLEVREILARVLRRLDLQLVEHRGPVEQLRAHTMAPSPRIRMRVRAYR
ncbi:cytochrome P450 [Amycolatopsis granulosa]|uniref:cytochrome P450 n=1 Tax=Amycolatopsis granulosa TaxID=185684 RepID=UPI00141F9E47|nr:cytochrome P450 [Amycolatopsis granulosa]NIH85177.1 hypothetical protein [Amycolatopsis granulosa]